LLYSRLNWSTKLASSVLRPNRPRST